MNTYNALSYYYDSAYLESVLTKDVLDSANHSDAQAKGGWSKGLGYATVSAVKAVNYRYFSDSTNHVLSPETRDCLDGLIIWTKIRAEQIMPNELEVGEVCISVTWYDAHPQFQALGQHIAPDFLTIPLYDSSSSRIEGPFFGQLAQDMGIAKAKSNKLVVKTRPRLCVVAIVKPKEEQEM